jgi:rRNA maturation endonuclease Nob1
MTLEYALREKKLIIKEPASDSLDQVQTAIKNSGDILRLSEVDKQLVALAITLKSGFNPVVVTDDYSIQNILEILQIPYRSVLTEGIMKYMDGSRYVVDAGRNIPQVTLQMNVKSVALLFTEKE